ncbi:aldehyde dehydrogenase family protein [Rhodohalobacter mucosus]|uniref:Aldehyde dehydrogenase n=1 Tax=Rhodohalobacter mucosus TaxID=2079485 RepID=A0A316TUK4_9BACT|nr:aldehyde dehydrogenase family protein [Rhodohalobacter mucosus]PWN07538.1 aldehyde dehydrogenase [Rhodohalobacter mucosus]
MSQRVDVLKTYKTYVGGSFPRSESEQTYQIKDSSDKVIANACRCTRKDVRDAVGAAASSFNGWKTRSAYNRGQILYRIAEMLEGRKEQFVGELSRKGMKQAEAEFEVQLTVDRLIYYAGWTDKYPQVFGSVNPVASAHFNFSVPEPTGVIGIISPDEDPLLSLVSLVAPVIAGGNTCVVLSSETNPLPAVTFGEVFHSSDVPGGVVNILTGFRNEMTQSLSSHKSVHGILNAVEDSDYRKLIDENASINVKRVHHVETENYTDSVIESPYLLLEFQEIKTTWHPAGN